MCRNQQTMQPFNEELKILVDALRQIGQKGELKVVEWIRGSSVSWTNAYNKKPFHMVITEANLWSSGGCL